MRYRNLIFICCIFLAFPLFAGEFVVVVNKENSINTISKSHLRRIYTGKLNDMNGKKVVPINLALDSETAKRFLKVIVKKSPDGYKEFWVAQQVKGLGSAPMIQKTSEAVIALVSQIPGALGYVEKGKETDAVKVLEVR